MSFRASLAWNALLKSLRTRALQDPGSVCAPDRSGRLVSFLELRVSMRWVLVAEHRAVWVSWSRQVQFVMGGSEAREVDGVWNDYVT